MAPPPTRFRKTMFNARHLLRAVSARLIAASCLMLGAVTAHAQTITNIASARWNIGAEEYSVQSNRVSFLVQLGDAELHTFTPLPGSDVTAELLPQYCSAGTTGGGLSPQDHTTISTPIVETGTLVIGQTLVLRLDAPMANVNPVSIDQIVFEMTTMAGDREIMPARESAPNSGEFFASIPTTGTPPPVVHEDCKLSLSNGGQIAVSAHTDGGTETLASGTVDALADPFGMVFDSADGRPVDGAKVTLVNNATGAPAQVFGFDGVTPYPSTVISGQPVTDSAGTIYNIDPGEYVFPLTAMGTYRLEIEPPAPYSAPSEATPAQIALLQRPDGSAFRITPASYGGTFTLASLDPYETDIPIDAPGAAITITKNVSRAQAQPGDLLYYQVTLRNADASKWTLPITLTDASSQWLRLRDESVRIDRVEVDDADLAPHPDGHGFALAIDSIPPGEARVISYVMSVRADAPPGEATNRATGLTEDGVSATAQANVKILRDAIADRMTLIGRVTNGNCEDSTNAPGVAGVRVMLEDGSYAITDETGRYHFEGLVPGTHVVQAASETLPEGGRFLQCADSTRSAGSSTSKFVWGQGGSLVTANFIASVPEGAASVAEAASTAELSDQDASGANTDWFSFGNGPAEFLYPTAEHNPRSPAVRVAIRHANSQSVTLLVDGKAVDPLSYEGASKSPDKRWSVSLWRGVRLTGTSTQLTAIVKNAKGEEIERLEREVRFADTPMRAEIVRERSNLVADGVTRPVVAVRFLDRYSRPVHSGISGNFTLDGPYIAASAMEQRQSQILTGLGSASASWVVEGDDGIALIKLAPTMVSGALDVTFQFSDGEISREEKLQAWIAPGDMPWTLIGLAEGSVGSRNIAENMERAGNFDSDLGDNARVAFYAKGRVLGKFLLTASYDSAKQEADQRLLGVIDPAAYYTVFGDSSERLFDASSQEKLYVRVESAAFYALYGDFETGFDETDLGRYQRTMTGFKGEARHAGFAAEAFAAKTGMSHQRDEIQGNGLTGPYQLSNRYIIPNSEKVAIEVRDRLRSEMIVERRELSRFIDYDIDLMSGTISFSSPIASRDIFLNPQYIVIDYETDGNGQENWNGGLRASWTNDSGSLRVGGTAITDRDDAGRTNLYAADARLRVGGATEIRAEAAISTQDGETSNALSLEVEHRTDKLDLIAYAKQIDGEFGVRQQNLSERGRRKIGTDLRVAIDEQWSIIGSGWYDQGLDDDSKRRAVEVRTAWRDQKTDAFLGLSYLHSTTPDGESGASTMVEAGVTRRMLDNRLELSAATSMALGTPEAIDLPARHRFGARYSLSSDVKLVGTYEIAESDTIDSRSLQGGLEFSAWNGSRIVTTVGKQSMGGSTVMGGDAQRTFAAFGLGQTLRVTEKLSIDATIDGNRTIGGGIELDEVVNPNQPVSSGGYLGQDGGLGEDFTSGSVGATWQSGRWNARARAEYRDGEWADRQGFAFAAIRQLGEGSAVGGGFNWTKAEADTGASSKVVDAALSFAHRPSNSPLSVLTKLEYRSDMVQNAVEGETGPAGRSAFTVNGDAQSKRLILSVSSNWTPLKGPAAQRTEIGLFAGIRQSLDEYDGFDLKGTTLMGGADVRVGITEKVDIGGRATIRANVSEGSYSFAVGPEIGFTPADNMLLSVGYNLVGFRDHDFSAARSTDKGFFATFRMKFDNGTLDLLGLGRRAQ
jgi:hypothetical protein